MRFEKYLMGTNTIFFFFNGRTCSIWKFLGQGLNPSHSCSNTGSFNPPSEARDGTHIFMDTSWVLNPRTATGTPNMSVITPTLQMRKMIRGEAEELTTVKWWTTELWFEQRHWVQIPPAYMKGIWDKGLRAPGSIQTEPTGWQRPSARMLGRPCFPSQGISALNLEACFPKSENFVLFRFCFLGLHPRHT